LFTLIDYLETNRKGDPKAAPIRKKLI
jgi:hypothetical protein